MRKPATEEPKVLASFQTSFVVTIGLDDKKQIGVIIRTSDGKQNAFIGTNLKAALGETYKRIRKRMLFNRKFPSPEPGRIITLDQAGSSLITANGRNGHWSLI